MINVGAYHIRWETIGELIPKPYYSNIEKTIIKITNKKDNVITVPIIFDIPIGGNSLKSFFKLTNSPSISLEINLKLDGDYKDITLNTNKITFKGLETE